MLHPSSSLDPALSVQGGFMRCKGYKVYIEKGSRNLWDREFPELALDDARTNKDQIKVDHHFSKPQATVRPW